MIDSRQGKTERGGFWRTCECVMCFGPYRRKVRPWRDKNPRLTCSPFCADMLRRVRGLYESNKYNRSHPLTEEQKARRRERSRRPENRAKRAAYYRKNRAKMDAYHREYYAKNRDRIVARRRGPPEAAECVMCFGSFERVPVDGRARLTCSPECHQVLAVVARGQVPGETQTCDPAKRSAYNKKWRAANAEGVRAYQAAYFQKNKEKLYARRNALRKARKAQNVRKARATVPDMTVWEPGERA